MGKFTKISPAAFAGMQLGAGILLRTFDPALPAAPRDEDVICATSGGVEAVCEPSWVDLGEDVDNCPKNTKELKYLDRWTCTLRFTALEISEEMLLLALGAADAGAGVTPRQALLPTDFRGLWWVGDRTDGGMVAIQLRNALSEEGLHFKSKRAGKGELDVTLTGHTTLGEQTGAPMTFYTAAPAEAQ